jgi:hypothetical protein
MTEGLLRLRRERGIVSARKIFHVDGNGGDQNAGRRRTKRAKVLCRPIRIGNIPLVLTDHEAAKRIEKSRQHPLLKRGASGPQKAGYL